MYDRLIAHFPVSAVFRDLDSIPLGKPFPAVLKEALAKTTAGLVVIGPHWSSITDEQGQRRLNDPSDFVRQEVEALLAMTIPVIPCLVSNAAMPTEAELPNAIKPLVSRQAIAVRPDPDFHRDMDRLIAQLSACVAAGSELEPLRRFRTYIATQPDVPMKVANWAKEIDDELFLVTCCLASDSRRRDSNGRAYSYAGATVSQLKRHAHPLGVGRTVAELINELHRVGILAPTSEEIRPGSQTEIDARRDPSYDFGSMFPLVYRYLYSAGFLDEAPATQGAEPIYGPSSQERAR